MIDGKQQVLSLGMDMQLEWLTLEDLQKHLDGEDANHVSTEPISSSEYLLGERDISYLAIQSKISYKCIEFIF